jgi:hypothetical protein
LCPIHHRIIDEDEEAFPVERLHLIKDEHEAWVAAALAPEDDQEAAGREIYAGASDAAHEAFDFHNWDSWSYRAFEAIPSWDRSQIDRISAFRRKMLQSPWPGRYVELERALARKLAKERKHKSGATRDHT